MTQNVESKELVIFCHLPAAQLDTAERPKMMDEENVRLMLFLYLMVKCILSTVWSFFITVGSKRDTESSNARRSGREAKQF